MKTRRKGGAGESFFGSLFGSKPAQQTPISGQPNTPAQPTPEGQPIQEAVPVDPNDPKVDAGIKAEAVPVQENELKFTARTGNESIDDEVAKLTKEEGYYFRAMINAIGICNSTMKMKYNALNPLNPEAFVCGDECHKRADIIRKTIERLIPYLQRSDALGYISSQRVLFNSLGYLGNSAASLGSKAASGLYNAPSAIANAPSAIGNAVSNAPSSIFNAAIKARDNITASVNAIDKYTRRAPPVSPAQPVSGGRRRTRRR